MAAVAEQAACFSGATMLYDLGLALAERICRANHLDRIRLTVTGSESGSPGCGRRRRPVAASCCSCRTGSPLSKQRIWSW
ncbi:MAG TPA: hypothetical protein VFQ44_17440 [Streptosporangiaceae bacterium]|nr:hypothetical protein [Streptosporangiaceae bacterium]